jgi:LmbE family N-acetylglucosaminyl deacetylase
VILHERPKRALAVFAHPDDPEVACAGTLATWTSGGTETHLVIANAGEKGIADPATDGVALAKIRRAEAEEASALLGLASVQFLDYADGELENTTAFRTQLIEIVRALRPEVVISPDPTAVFFGDSYVNHHDHRALGWAVLDIGGSMAGGARYAPDAGPPHQILTLLLAGTLEPDTWVDIGGALDAKVGALRCHRSQLGDTDRDDMVAALVEARAAEAGQAAGVRYAEGFRRLSFGAA